MEQQCDQITECKQAQTEKTASVLSHLLNTSCEFIVLSMSPQETLFLTQQDNRVQTEYKSERKHLQICTPDPLVKGQWSHVQKYDNMHVTLHI